MRPPTRDLGHHRRRKKGHSDMRPALSVDPRVHKALTDLYMYVLALDAERQRVEERMASLDSSGVNAWTRARRARRRGAATDPEELSRLGVRHTEIASQLEMLRATIDALRLQADPASKHL
jgi:hypothetical protein